ncbi:SH3 domain-containing protein [Methylobacterium sp. Leaf123]|uniref:SH3 domain-containing protein n=1 Tax=Methylobacterium sp. Leaf123 TaxID=1736264 RepID=UPI000A6738B5|nr:SH3 domain-containing protein [Methylobacterium sp. Leaf123]
MPETLYVSGRKVALRGAADQKGQILDRLGPGQAVTALERRPGWVRVRHGLTQREGWIQAKRLRDAPPAEEAEKPPAPKAAPALSVAAIAKLLIAESIASYPGSCACPYQTDRGGRSCGRRSAHSRPGGYSPLCYPADITPEMVASYRSSR